jgi:hypothetical protein
MRRTTIILVLTVAAFSGTLARESAAGPLSKDECIDAHSRGQDLRERGALVRAKQTFMTCAQSTCPALVQGDCARLGEELAHLVPTVTFGARDKNANDLPATSVFVDDVLFASRLDDGKTYEVDPGRHTVRYVHEGTESTLHVIVNQGEKGRLFVARFVDVDTQHANAEPLPLGELWPPSGRSKLPLLVAGLGAAAAVTGGVLFGVGVGNVPSSCSVGTRECAAPIGDPSLAKAHEGMALANVGLAVGGAGLVALATGLVWYFVQPLERGRRASRTPFFQF